LEKEIAGKMTGLKMRECFPAETKQWFANHAKISTYISETASAVYQMSDCAADACRMNPQFQLDIAQCQCADRVCVAVCVKNKCKGKFSCFTHSLVSF
jgi:hypothetical protein